MTCYSKLHVTFKLAKCTNYVFNKKPIEGRATLTFYLFDLGVNACRATAMHCMSTTFLVDSLSRFSFRARTQKHT